MRVPIGGAISFRAGLKRLATSTERAWLNVSKP